MAYQATVIPIMIASPGDVTEERNIIRAVIHDWNDINAEAFKVMLTPVGWDTHSSPDLGGRPQELLNKQVLKDCDLLVGVFWTRLGSPTGKEQSGTVEEIKEHIGAGKPAMVYFSSKPVALESVDSAQYSEVKAFEKECKTLGLVEGFDSADEFKKKFTKQLNLNLRQNEYLKALVEPKPETTSLMSLDDFLSEKPIVLSEESETLLKAAAEDDRGSILKLSYIGGGAIQAGGKSFGDANAREFAKWENALKDLLYKHLVVARGLKGESFELTHEGWIFVDKLCR